MLHSYKVVMCGKRYPHNWKRCPFAHDGEAARRRDPRTHSYSDVMCPEARKGQTCPRGDSCPFTHSLFEYWLLPSRFKTQLCSKRSACRRPFCFFAHDEAELREPGVEDDLLFGPLGPIDKREGFSALHDSCASYHSFTAGSEGAHCTPDGAKSLAPAVSASDCFYPQSSWESPEQSVSSMLPESLLSIMEQEVNKTSSYPDPVALDQLQQAQIILDNLQISGQAVQSQPQPFQSYQQPVVLPSAQILKSLWSGRSYTGGFFHDS